MTSRRDRKAWHRRACRRRAEQRHTETRHTRDFVTYPHAEGGLRARYIEWCATHGKESYTRDQAREQVRGLNRSRRGEYEGGRVRRYPCVAAPRERDLWHVGHVPRDVVRGATTMIEINERRRRERRNA